MPATGTGSGTPLRLAGVDGCPSGWIAVGTQTHSGCAAAPFRDSPASITWSIAARFQDLLSTPPLKEADAIAVDMPIGLPEIGPRPCDGLARKVLKGRASCIFSPPGRALLGLTDYAEANARSRTLCGKGLSRQAFFIAPKIAELDRVMTPAAQERIVEGHPELVFARLAGSPLLLRKKNPDGREARLALLESQGLASLRALLGDVAAAVPRRSCAPDDVIDAAALLFAAAAKAGNGPPPLTEGDCDPRGLKMAIWG